MQVYEGIQATGYENIHYSQDYLVIRDLAEKGLFVPTKEGAEKLGYINED